MCLSAHLTNVSLSVSTHGWLQLQRPTLKAPIHDTPYAKKEKKMHMILHKGTSSIRNRVVENISCGRECTSLLLIELQSCEIALHCSTILENCSRIRKDNMRKVHLRVGGAGSLHDLLISQDREDYTHMMQRSSTKFNSHDREKTGVGRKDSSEVPCKCRQRDMLLQVCSFQMKSTE